MVEFNDDDELTFRLSPRQEDGQYLAIYSEKKQWKIAVNNNTYTVDPKVGVLHILTPQAYEELKHPQLATHPLTMTAGENLFLGDYVAVCAHDNKVYKFDSSLKESVPLFMMRQNCPKNGTFEYFL